MLTILFFIVQSFNIVDYWFTVARQQTTPDQICTGLWPRSSAESSAVRLLVLLS